jgi:hypothetical protein
MNTHLNSNRKPWTHRVATLTLALAAAAWATCFAPVQASAAKVTTVAVQSYQTVVPPGAQAQIPVSLKVREGSHSWQPVPGKTLTVRALRAGGTRPAEEFLRTTVRTDANGNATIQFTMPPRHRNNAGNPVGTSVAVYVQFGGDATVPPGNQSRAIHLIVGN